MSYFSPSILLPKGFDEKSNCSNIVLQIVAFVIETLEWG